MPYCPVCSIEFGDGAVVCPHDGVLLVDKDPLVGATLDGKYRIDSRLGAGGMGAVYRGVQLALQRPVAIKVIIGAGSGIPLAVKRFEREALAVARLRHPHIVAVYDYGIASGIGAYLVLEFLEGRTLMHELRQRGALPLDESLRWFGQICAAVQAAHTAGLVHRDLKPDNVVIERVEDERVAKVLDFGIAKFLAEGEFERTPLSRSGGILGTPYYMSPEQCRGEQVGPASDVYALGCVLFQMVTGRVPFEGTSVPALLYQHVSVAPPSPSAYAPSIPHSLEHAILKALAKDPHDRFASASAFRAAVAGMGALASATTLPLAHGVASEGIAGASHRAPHNLPAEVSRLVGRDREVEELRQVLSNARLATVTGSGGIGKTRIVLKVASMLFDAFQDGVWLVELGSLSDPSLVDGAVASVFGLGDQPGRTSLDALLGHLRNRRLLLVLDNCEHLIDASAALVTSLLRGCPELKVVSSSREPLAVEGEHVFQLAPLPVVDEALARAASQALECDAIRLFADRAHAARPSWRLTDEDAPDVARLCSRLDGIPLAIELAAARVPVLTIGQIVDRIGGHLSLLGGSRSVPARHRTLEATIEWSYNLLSEPERRLFERMSVFAGGWTLEAAEAVGASGDIDSHEVLPLLVHLVEKSLVVMDERPEGARYRMLETIRTFSDAKLCGGERTAALDKHLAWVLRAVEAAFANYGGAEHDRWRQNVAVEHANAIAALAAGSGRPEASESSLQLAVALGAYWEAYGFWTLGRQWIQTCSAACPEADTVLRARANFRLASLAHRQGQYVQAESLYRDCLERLEGSDRVRMRAEALMQLGRVLGAQGRVEEQRILLTEAVGLHRASGSAITLASALQALGETSRHAGEFDDADRWLSESLDLFRSAEYQEGISVALIERAKVSLCAGDGAGACRQAYEALEVARAGGFEILVAQCQRIVGESLIARGEWSRARTSLCDALRRAYELGAIDDTVDTIEGLARVTANAGDVEGAFRLACFARTHREAMKDPLPNHERVAAEAFRVELRDALGDIVADASESAAASMKLADAVSLAVRGGRLDAETEFT